MCLSGAQGAGRRAGKNRGRKKEAQARGARGRNKGERPLRERRVSCVARAARLACRQCAAPARGGGGLWSAVRSEERRKGNGRERGKSSRASPNRGRGARARTTRTLRARRVARDAALAPGHVRAPARGRGGGSQREEQGKTRRRGDEEPTGTLLDCSGESHCAMHYARRARLKGGGVCASPIVKRADDGQLRAEWRAKEVQHGDNDDE